MTSGGIDWQREKWRDGFGSKFIRQGEKNAAKYADEDDYDQILCYGISFFKKRCMVKKKWFTANLNDWMSGVEISPQKQIDPKIKLKK